MIGFDESKDGAQLDAAELPPFSNDSRCRCGNRRAIRVHYSPGSRDIVGPHFRRLCPCGAVWNERAAANG